MQHLSIDIETYSDVSIKDSGVYKYVESDNFEILLFAYSLDGANVQIIDLAAGEKIPDEIIKLMKSPDCIKHAYNAAFEFICLSKFYELDIRQWQCTMIHGLYCGYTAGLGITAGVLGLPQDKQKDLKGKNLIRYFCVPCNPTKTNGGRTRNYYYHDDEKWKLFKEYCIQDVVVEMEIENRLKEFPVPGNEWENWYIDQEINAFGVRIDTDLLSGALEVDEDSSEYLKGLSKKITGLENPNSISQLLPWINERVENPMENLQKAYINEYLVTEEINEDVKAVLKARLEASKTSVKKYKAMQNLLGKDERVRGLIQFYGANRTGRYAGRFVQVQNLPRNYIDTLELARYMVKNCEYENLRMVYGNVPDILSQLIRTAFIPSTGNKFIVADFSAIEARVIAWLAEEKWRLDVFSGHGKIYEASASMMFHVPIEKITKGNPEYALRQKGKVAELALGYQGGPGALVAMGALNMGLSEDELPDIVDAWRNANPNIVNLWKNIQNCAVKAVKTGGIFSYNGVKFSREMVRGRLDFLTITLPSGRKLFYVNPLVGTNEWGSEIIEYKGLDQTSKKWTSLKTYGGKLTENIVQAIARDCLAESINRIKKAGHDIVMHIHDEIVVDAPKTVTVEEICDIMNGDLDWAPGLKLRADGFESEFYKKD
jgi:DNA polymerase|nr:MAG TPA: DNA polymerase I [Caudoviricetes sp.]